MAEPNDQNPPPNPEPPANPEAAPPAPAPAVGWATWTPPEPGAPGTPEAPRRMVVRVAEAIAWIVGIAAVLFLGRVFILLNSSAGLSGFQQGEVIGRVVGAVVVGIVIRWVWVKLRKRGRVRSPWVLLIACASLAGGLSSSPGLIPAPAPAAPIGTYLKIGTPYVLESQSPAVDARFADAIAAFDATASEVRQISLDGEAVGFLLVVNIGASESDEFMNGAEGGFEKNPGAEAHRETIAAKTVMVGTSQDVHVVIWVEAPYGVILYAADSESSKALAASVIAAYQAGIAP